MHCPSCNQEIPDSARVCGYCGHKLSPAPPAAPPPTAAPPKRGLPGWVIALIGGLALVAIVAVVALVVLLMGRGRDREPTAVVPTATPVVVAATATSTPDVEAELKEIILRADQAEIDALRTLDPAPLEDTMSGDLLKRELDAIESLRKTGWYQISTQVSIDFLSFDITDETHAQVETIEVYTDEYYRLKDDVMLWYDPPEYGPQTYFLEKVGGRWLVYDIEFHRDPDHLPETEGLEVVSHRVERTEAQEGADESTKVFILLKNAGGTHLSHPLAFVTFYDATGESLGSIRAYCSPQILGTGDKARCLRVLSEDSENYPAGWKTYEFKPVGVPTEDEPIALTVLEERVVDRDGRPAIIGRLRNDDDRSLRYLGVAAIFYDDQGLWVDVVYSSHKAVAGGILEPGEVAPFEIWTFGEWARHELLPYGTITGMSPRTGLEVKDVSWTGNQLQGRVRNESGEVQEHIEVYTVCYDAGGQLIAVAQSYDLITLSNNQWQEFTIGGLPEDTTTYDLVVK